MRIAVTGGTGFFGRATINAAENAGHTVWAFDRTLGLDVLGNLKTELVRAEFGDANSSALISVPGDDGFKYVVMPMRI